MSTFETLTREQLAERLLAQGVSREHLAFRCSRCGAVQSLRSFDLAAVSPPIAELQIGSTCAVPECGWILVEDLGGGPLKVVNEFGRVRWCFAVATPDEARALMGRGGRIEVPAIERAAAPQTAADIPGQPQTAPATPAPAPTSRRRRARAPEAP